MKSTKFSFTARSFIASRLCSVEPSDMYIAILPSDQMSAIPGFSSAMAFASFYVSPSSVSIGVAMLASSGAMNLYWQSMLGWMPGMSAKPTSVMRMSLGSSGLINILFGCKFFIVYP